MGLLSWTEDMALKLGAYTSIHRTRIRDNNTFTHTRHTILFYVQINIMYTHESIIASLSLYVTRIGTGPVPNPNPKPMTVLGWGVSLRDKT